MKAIHLTFAFLLLAGTSHASLGGSTTTTHQARNQASADVNNSGHKVLPCGKVVAVGMFENTNPPTGKTREASAKSKYGQQ